VIVFTDGVTEANSPEGEEQFRWWAIIVTSHESRITTHEFQPPFTAT
jgi:hypothetical protein